MLENFLAYLKQGISETIDCSCEKRLLLSLSRRLALVAVNEDVFVLLLDGLVEVSLAVELSVGRHADDSG